MDVLTTLFSFRGRHNRARFFLITLVGLLWLGFCVPAFISYATTTQPAGRAAAAMIIICWLAIAIWCQSANLVKRLHDMGASGWWTLVIYAIGASFGMLGAAASPQARAESWPRKSGQDDMWSFCLTAGTLCPPNQERR
jgi:uncharacterized membrane protein YhaH (DUF805 family)